MAAAHQAAASHTALGSETAPAGDPLPSWREGAAKQAVLDFVEQVASDRATPFSPVVGEVGESAGA